MKWFEWLVRMPIPIPPPPPPMPKYMSMRIKRDDIFRVAVRAGHELEEAIRIADHVCTELDIAQAHDEYNEEQADDKE